MKNRKFGVEIECGIEGFTDDGYCDCGCGSCNDPTDEVVALMKRAKCSSEWDYCWDGTLIEFQTPILEGPSGFLELKKFMKTLCNEGGYVTYQDGMHVHHDAPEYVDDDDLTRQLVESWIVNREYIGLLVDPDRNGNGACPQWPEVQLFDTDTRYHGGRRDLNVSSLNKHGTVELRLHEGCLDFDRAESWIRFGQAFLNKVAAGKKALPTCENVEDLLRRIRVAQKSRERLVARAQENSAVNGGLVYA